MDEVVDEAGEEEEPAAGEDPDELAMPSRDRADRERGERPGDEAGEDSDPADIRRRPRVPAIRARGRDQPARGRRAQQREQHEGSGRKREEGRGCAHAWKANDWLLAFRTKSFGLRTTETGRLCARAFWRLSRVASSANGFPAARPSRAAGGRAVVRTSGRPP